MDAASQSGRTRSAYEWKADGRKVIGTLCSYVPEEIVYAAGMLPWRVVGSRREVVSHAMSYHPEGVCAHCTHVLEGLLLGDFDFLDGIVASNWDQDMVRLWDLWVFLHKSPFTNIFNMPHHASELACKALAQEFRALLGSLEVYGGRQITEESLRLAIQAYNQKRGLLMRLYELRKRTLPPVSGAECLAITMAGMVMPVTTFNYELEALLPYLEKERTSPRRGETRLLVSGDWLDSPDYVDLVEETGAVVAMDDLDTGSRYFWGRVDEQGDPIDALAKRYIGRPGCPRMYTWDSQVDQVIQWSRDFDIDGVVELVLARSRPRQMRVPFFRDALTKAGIPVLSVTREYQLANIGQLKTRVGAFLEMITAKRGARLTGNTGPD